MLKINIIIRRLNILSLTKMLTALYFVIGLVLALVLVSVLLFDASSFLYVGPSGFVSGMGLLVGIPIFYAVLGSLTGLIAGGAYNLCAGWLGGIELEALSEGMQYGGD